MTTYKFKEKEDGTIEVRTGFGKGRRITGEEREKVLALRNAMLKKAIKAGTRMLLRK